MKFTRHKMLLGSLAILLLVFCYLSLIAIVAEAQEAELQLLQQAQQLFKPLPKDMATAEVPITAAQIQLGRMLFFDPRLSLDGIVSCATCHKPALYGTDALSKSIGVEHRINLRNAPHRVERSSSIQGALDLRSHVRGGPGDEVANRPD